MVRSATEALGSTVMDPSKTALGRMEPGTAAGKEHDVSLETIRSWWKVPAVAHFCSLFRSTFKLPDFEIEVLILFFVLSEPLIK